MKYNIDELIIKRGNQDFIPTNGVDKLADPLVFYCNTCNTEYTGSGISYLTKKRCVVCYQKHKRELFRRRFLKAHKDNAADYIIIGYTDHYVLIQHNTPWCHRIQKYEYNDYKTNCAICFSGCKYDKNKYISSLIHNPSIHLIKRIKTGGQVQVYCDICKCTYTTWIKRPGIYYCKKCKRLEQKRLKDKKRKEHSSEYKRQLVAKRRTQKAPKGYNILYSKVKNVYYCIHHCLDGHIRRTKITKVGKGSKSCGFSICKVCKRLEREAYVKDLLIKFNPDYQLVTHYINFDTPLVLKNKVYNYYTYRSYHCLNKPIKCANRPVDNFSKCRMFQEHLDQLYGKGVYEVKDMDDEKAVVKHLLCGREYTYLIESLLDLDIRCKFCRYSLNEQVIMKILEEEKIPYKISVYIGAKHNGFDLPYDFLLPNKVLIEYDGVQHYQPIAGMGGEKEYKKRVVKDKIKTQYAKDHGYHLVRISYKNRGYKKVKRCLEKDIFPLLEQV